MTMATPRASKVPFRAGKFPGFIFATTPITPVPITAANQPGWKRLSQDAAGVRSAQSDALWAVKIVGIDHRSLSYAVKLAPRRGVPPVRAGVRLQAPTGPQHAIRADEH